jgi:ABC-type multidrug transport system fused ATPase/permease subunit
MNIGNILYVLCATFGGLFLVTNFPNLSISGLKFSIDIIIPFLNMTKQFTGNVNQVSQQINSIAMALAGAQRVFALMDEKPEDDDGYVCKTGVYAGSLSEEEMEELLTEKGMSYVQCWGEYFREESVIPELGEVVEVFNVEEEDIEEVAAIAGKDPEEYEQIGFFESLSEEITEATDFRASKEFWSAAKIGSMDEDAFHKAFVLPD